MHKFSQDDLYLLVDFLEEQLENARDVDYRDYSQEELESFADNEAMFEMSIEVIKDLIKE
jgi:hypothetical protein